MSQILDAIALHARTSPDAIALSSRSERLTYPDLALAVERTAEKLAALAAFRPQGSPVGIELPNSPAWVILDLALIRLGWPSLPLAAFFSSEQRAHALADSGACFIIRGAGEAPVALEVAGARLSLDILCPSGLRLPPTTAKVTYTSGSTGHPKGVCLSQGQMESVAGSLVEVIGASYAGRHLPVLPLSILLENVAGLYSTLIAGGEYRVLGPEELGQADPFRPDMPTLAAAIFDQQATSLILVPELLRALLMVMTFSGITFPCLRLVAVGGAKVSPALLARATDLGLPVFEGYGLSECASVVALNTPASRKNGSVGRPLSHLKIRIGDDGEIIAGPQPFLGYAGGAEAPAEVHTGDIGHLDADGFLHISGRRGALIINAFGRNISPEWVESELLAQPEIRQALVFGEAQPELGALIVPLAPTMDEGVIAQAVARANAALPAFAQIRRWRLRGPFDAAAGELTGNGRPRRAVLLSRHGDFIEAPH